MAELVKSEALQKVERGSKVIMDHQKWRLQIVLIYVLGHQLLQVVCTGIFILLNIDIREINVFLAIWVCGLLNMKFVHVILLSIKYQAFNIQFSALYIRL